MLSPPGLQSHILMLAESEGDKTRWVGALNELHKVLRKNKIPDKSVCIFLLQVFIWTVSFHNIIFMCFCF